jgi:hypothetical protein
LPQALVRQIKSKAPKRDVLPGLHAMDRPAERFLLF